MEKDRGPDMEDKFQTYLKRLSIDYSEILHCLDNLGLICAHLVFFLSQTTSFVFIIGLSVPSPALPFVLIFRFFFILPSLKATEVCLEKISDTKEESEIYKECSLLCMQFLEDILSTLGVHLQQGTVFKALFCIEESVIQYFVTVTHLCDLTEEKTSVDLQQTHLSVVNLRRVSPKLKELFHLLNSFR